MATRKALSRKGREISLRETKTFFPLLCFPPLKKKLNGIKLRARVAFHALGCDVAGGNRWRDFHIPAKPITPQTNGQFPPCPAYKEALVARCVCERPCPPQSPQDPLPSSREHPGLPTWRPLDVPDERVGERGKAEGIGQDD